MHDASLTTDSIDKVRDSYKSGTKTAREWCYGIACAAPDINCYSHKHNTNKEVSDYVDREVEL